MQIIFVFVCSSFAQGNHQHFVFAKEEPVKRGNLGKLNIMTPLLIFKTKVGRSVHTCCVSKLSLCLLVCYSSYWRQKI